LHDDSGQRGLALDLGFQRSAPALLVLALHVRDPVDRLEQPRRPQGAQHGVDRLVLQQALGARPQPVGIALVMLLPVLQHLVNRDPLPPCCMVVVDRVALAQAEDRLSIESERVGHQPVEDVIARQPAADGLEPQQESRGDRRRPRIATGARDQHFRRAESTGEVVRGKTDAAIGRGHTQRRSHLRRKPRIGRGKRRPHALVQSAEHDQVGALQARFE
jgi:hypothetical protein